MEEMYKMAVDLHYMRIGMEATLKKMAALADADDRTYEAYKAIKEVARDVAELEGQIARIEVELERAEGVYA